MIKKSITFDQITRKKNLVSRHNTEIKVAISLFST